MDSDDDDDRETEDVDIRWSPIIFTIMRAALSVEEDAGI